MFKLLCERDLMQTKAPIFTFFLTADALFSRLYHRGRKKQQIIQKNSVSYLQKYYLQKIK